ncbi:MAG: acyl carrier protein [Bacteroidota bacterium]
MTPTGKIGLDGFVKHFESQFEEIEAGTVQPDHEFRQLPGWSSMQSLIVIASFDWEYSVTVSADELRGATTVRDLFEIVQRKIG